MERTSAMEMLIPERGRIPLLSAAKARRQQVLRSRRPSNFSLAIRDALLLEKLLEYGGYRAAPGRLFRFGEPVALCAHLSGSDRQFGLRGGHVVETPPQGTNQCAQAPVRGVAPGRNHLPGAGIRGGHVPHRRLVDPVLPPGPLRHRPIPAAPGGALLTSNPTTMPDTQRGERT